MNSKAAFDNDTLRHKARLYDESKLESSNKRQATARQRDRTRCQATPSMESAQSSTTPRGRPEPLARVRSPKMPAQRKSSETQRTPR